MKPTKILLQKLEDEGDCSPSDHAKFLLVVRKFYVAAVEYIKANSLLQMKSVHLKFNFEKWTES